MAILTITGITLHAVQDFYSHSNWVDDEQRALNAQTWFDAEFTGSTPGDILTGSFKNSKFPNEPRPTHAQLNRDSYKRRRWSYAYAAAYAASRQWLREIAAIVETERPGLWTQCTQKFTIEGTDAEDLDRDLSAAYYTSLWVPDGDGHWKGPGSANPGLVATYLASWAQMRSSRFVNEIKERLIFAYLTSNLYEMGTKIPSDLPVIKPYVLNEQAVVITTIGAQADVGTEGDSGKPDMFASLTVSVGATTSAPQMTFVEATQRDNSGGAPSTAGSSVPGWPWISIMMVPRAASLIHVKYELWDETATERQSLDLTGQVNKWHLDFDFNPSNHVLSGDITGAHDIATNPAEAKGDTTEGLAGHVWFIVTTEPLQQSP